MQVADDPMLEERIISDIIICQNSLLLLFQPSGINNLAMFNEDSNHREETKTPLSDRGTVDLGDGLVLSIEI